VREDVIKRIGSFGYKVNETADSWAIEFIVEKTVNSIKNECNIAEIPAGLHYIAVDMVCGEFLMMKKGSGQLDGFEVDLNSAALKQLQEGDTSITFAVDSIASPEQRLDALIYFLTNNGKPQFVTYRRLKWT
jgi:hypothetical protein